MIVADARVELEEIAEAIGPDSISRIASRTSTRAGRPDLLRARPHPLPVARSFRRLQASSFTSSMPIHAASNAFALPANAPVPVAARRRRARSIPAPTATSMLRWQGGGSRAGRDRIQGPGQGTGEASCHQAGVKSSEPSNEPSPRASRPRWKAPTDRQSDGRAPPKRKTATRLPFFGRLPAVDSRS